MDKYYKDLAGKKYRFVSIAKGADNKQQAVLQKLFGKGEYVVLPFSSKEGEASVIGADNHAFTPIKDEEEALRNIPIFLDPKYRFPDIDYGKETPLMDNSDGGVKGMMTLLKKQKIFDDNYFVDLETPEDIEKRILKLIGEYEPSDESLLSTIFHLIQVWGGMSGRHIYVRGEGFNWDKIKDSYGSLVDACLNTYNTDDASIDNLVSVVRTVSDEVDFLGISFVTKHTYFWLHKNLSDNALPIYDSIMALEIMRRNEVRGSDLANYWKVMVAKSYNLNISVKALERQIYLYSRNNR